MVTKTPGSKQSVSIQAMQFRPIKANGYGKTRYGILVSDDCNEAILLSKAKTEREFRSLVDFNDPASLIKEILRMSIETVHQILDGAYGKGLFVNGQRCAWSEVKEALSLEDTD